MHVCLYWATLTLRESSGQDWEMCGKGTVVCASTLSHLERKGLSEAASPGAAFLGSPYVECFKVKLRSTCLSIIHQAEGAGEERELQSLLGMRGWYLQPTTTCWVWLVWDSEAICATS